MSAPSHPMHCPVCNTENDQETQRCLTCDSPLPESRAPTSGSSNLAEAITQGAILSNFSRVRRDATSSRVVISSPGYPANGSAVAPALALDFGPRYRIEKKLGEGGMGEVYKATDLEVDRTVALKVIRPELVVHPDALQRFKQEMVLASRISHKNVLRIHDLGEAAGVKFISMAYIEGQNLAQLIEQQKALPVETAVNIGKQLCAALDAAHSEGVVHRDLKPQNVLLDKNGCVYVSDFGLAKSLESDADGMGMTLSGQIVGTPQYLAPEQVEGLPADHRSDLYALGLILYEMVTGSTPFQATSRFELMMKRVREKAPTPKLANAQLPNYLTQIILRALERDPALRYQSAREILADLESGTAPKLGPRVIVQKLLKNDNARLSIIVAVAVLLVLGIVLVSPLSRLVVRQGSSGGPVTAAQIQGRYVAVLPLRVLGDQESLRYAADGLTDALATKLFHLKDVHVAADSEVQKVKDQPLDRIVSALSVNFIAYGSIQASGDKIRITLQLEDMAKHRLLCSEEFSGVKDDLLSLEDQMYAKLVDALQVKPSTEEQALSGHPTEVVAAYDSYLRGREAMRNQLDIKSVEAAIHDYEVALNQDPRFALAYAGLADASIRMYREQKDRLWADKALVAAQQAQQLNSTLPEVHLSLGSVYISTGRTTEAIAELKRSIELAPNSDEPYRRLGDAYKSSGLKTEAIAAYQKAIQLNPYYWFNYNALGSAYVQFQDSQNAIKTFQKVIELDPNNGAAYRNLGRAYFNEGKLDDSVKFLEKAVKLEPHRVTYVNLGTALFYLKRYDEAANMFQKAVEMSPKYELAVGDLADAYRWSNRPEQAATTYDKAIALAFDEIQVNPRDSGSMGRLALYYAKRGNIERALDFIARARAIDSANVDLIYNQAVVYELAGQRNQALEILKQALAKGYSPDNLKTDPEMAKLQTSKEFAQLFQKPGKAK